MEIAGRAVGIREPFFLIAGPCVIESRDLVLRTAETLAALCRDLDIALCFKASYDKANRTSGGSFRGPGLDEGLAILAEVRSAFEMPVLTDVHGVEQVRAAAEVVDILQIPAFLCRQTDLVEAAAGSGRLVNIKKGQFLAPEDMLPVVEKARGAGAADRVLVCERGASFGYHNLVVDMRSLEILRRTDCPVVFDATHSVQLPGGQGASSGGQREFVPLLARAAVAAGISGLFMETHPDPDRALSDGPNSWPLDRLAPLLAGLKDLDEAVKTRILNSG